MKKQPRRLALAKQTIATLSTTQLRDPRGGNESSIIILASYPCTAYQCPTLIVDTHCTCA
jgi:hypothetical protein